MQVKSDNLVYILLVGLPLLGATLIIGSSGWSYQTRQAVVGGAVSPFTLLSFVIEIVVILIVARIVASLFRRLGQPSVVGEMTAGFLLGPSVLGALAPGVSAALFPPAGLHILNLISQLGLVLFMFLVGIHLDVTELRHNGRSAILISHTSIAVPLFCGVLLARYLYSRAAPSNVEFLGFALFMGTAMAITAFPVLARILNETGMHRSRIGTIATACAAVDDITGWFLLAVVVILVRGSELEHSFLVRIVGIAAFIGGMVGIVRPKLRHLFPALAPLTDLTVGSAVLLAFSAAVVTEYLGIHALFGAFLAGTVMPRRPDLVDHIGQRLETLTNVVLLPMFFAYSGLRAHFGFVHDAEMWAYTGLIILTAVIGKFGGTMIAARASGFSWSEAGVLGALMNTRGLMELVALNIGFDIGVITQSLYSVMVFMTLVTTAMTGPLVRLLSAIDTKDRVVSPTKLR